MPTGVDIIFNGSGSHHQLRKLETRMDLMRGATAKAGGVYAYANQRGGDGGRLYYDGCACVFSNGNMVAQGAQFGLKVSFALASYAISLECRHAVPVSSNTVAHLSPTVGATDRLYKLLNSLLLVTVLECVLNPLLAHRPSSSTLHALGHCASV